MHVSSNSQLHPKGGDFILTNIKEEQIEIKLLYTENTTPPFQPLDVDPKMVRQGTLTRRGLLHENQKRKLLIKGPGPPVSTYMLIVQCPSVLFSICWWSACKIHWGWISFLKEWHNTIDSLSMKR